MDEDLKHVTEMFPNVENEWIRSRLDNGISVEAIVNFILSNPEAIPKKIKPSPVQKKKEPKKADVEKTIRMKTPEITKNRSPKRQKAYLQYFDISIEVTEEYANAAFSKIADYFDKIILVSLDSVFKIFKCHFAPTMVCLTKSLENYDLRLERGNNIPAKGLPDGEAVDLKVLFNRRRKRYALCPAELVAEIEWTKNYLEKENSVTGQLGEQNSNIVFIKKVECGICYDDYPFNEMWPCNEGHLFCIDCLRNYSKETIYGQGKAALTCLENDCKAGFCRDVLNKALDEEWLKKLDEREQQESINCANIENLVRCKYCNCAVIIDVPVEVDKVFKCINPECERQVCRICDMDWSDHIGIPCKEFETKDEERLRKQIEEKMFEAVVRRCNKCKAELIKESGCNKMTCRCGAKMCYVCRQPDIEYDHFCRHLRSPGKPCKTCTSCSLWEDTTKSDKEILLKLKTEAEQAQNSLGTGRNRLIGGRTPPRSSDTSRPLIRSVPVLGAHNGPQQRVQRVLYQNFRQQQDAVYQPFRPPGPAAPIAAVPLIPPPYYRIPVNANFNNLAQPRMQYHQYVPAQPNLWYMNNWQQNQQ